jgi:hypothetical protein
VHTKREYGIALGLERLPKVAGRTDSLEPIVKSGNGSIPGDGSLGARTPIQHNFVAVRFTTEKPLRAHARGDNQ